MEFVVGFVAALVLAFTHCAAFGVGMVAGMGRRRRINATPQSAAERAGRDPGVR